MAEVATRLDVGRSVVRSFTGQDAHSYALELESERFVYGEVVQTTVDVSVAIYSPSGRRLGVFDGTAKGVEPVQFTSSEASEYRVVITPFKGQQGDYKLTINRLEPLATQPELQMGQLMASLDRDDVPGGVVAVVQHGKLLFARGYGLANVEYGIRNTPDTPYHIASVSKQFTAFAIALLAEQGKLSLDDDVRRYLPELPSYGHTITLRHLLNQTSGLRDQFVLWAMAGGREDDVIRQEDLLRLIMRQRELNFIPGSEYDYTNSGYLLLAEVVPRVTGRSFRDWMAANVFEPTGMAHTQINDSHERLIPGRAYAYDFSTEGVKQTVLNSASTGATGVMSTAKDLVQWIRNWTTGQVGGKEVLAQMQQVGVLNNGEKSRYALGVNVRNYRGLRRLDHGGFQAGYRTMVAYYPEIEGGIVVLGNTPSFKETILADQITDIFFASSLETKESPLPRSQPKDSSQTVQPTPWNPTPTELAQFEGRFHSSELETTYTVAFEKGKIIVRHRRMDDVHLLPAEKDAFKGKNWMFARVEFERDQNGVVSRMRVTPSNERVRRLAFDSVSVSSFP